MIKRENVQIFWNENKDLKITEVLICDSSIHTFEEINKLSKNLLCSDGNICGDWLDPITPEMIFTKMIFKGFKTEDHLKAAAEQFYEIEGMKTLIDYLRW